MKLGKRPLLLLASFFIITILFFDRFLTSEANLPAAEVSLTGKISAIQMKEREGKKTYNLTVKDVPKPYYQLLLRVEERVLKKAFFKASNSKKEVLIGDLVRFQGRFREFETAENKGQFDARTFYKNENYRGHIKVKSMYFLNESVFHKIFYFFPRLLFKMKLRMSAFYEKILGEINAGTLSAMILGDRSSLDEEIKDLYASHSISHLLAISGLHISLIAGMISFLCKKMKFSFRTTAIVPILVLILYGTLTGFPLSATRAIFMMILFFASFLLGRTYDIPSALSFSAILLLLKNSGLLYQASFQLSFFAVIGIFYSVRLFGENSSHTEEKDLPFRKVLLKTVFLSMASTVAIHLAMLPILLWHYYEISFSGIFLNILVIPLMSILVSAGLLGGLAGFFFFSLSVFILGSANYILHFNTYLCYQMSHLPYYKMILGRPELYQIFFYYFFWALCHIIIWKLHRQEQLLFLRGKLQIKHKVRNKRVKRMLILVLLPLALFILILRKEETFQTNLYVGKGSCKIIKNEKGEVTILDCGSKNIKKVGTYRLVPFLKYHGIRTVQKVIVTGVEEEKVGGILELLNFKEIKIQKLIFPVQYKGREKDFVNMTQLIKKANDRQIPYQYVKLEKDSPRRVEAKR